MSSKLQLHIGTHSIKVMVEEQDKPAMLAAARRVDQMLSAMRQDGNEVDGARAAIKVALQLASGTTSQLDDGDLATLDGLLDEALATVRIK